MYATDFEYADKRLSDFNCITCYIDGSASVEEMNIGCDISFNTVKNNHSSIHSKTSSSYDNVYTTTFQIMKKDYQNEEDKYFSYDEVRSLYKWLNRHDYKKFKPLPDDDQCYDIHYYGSFNIAQIFVNGKIAGLTLTFTANAPYGFGEDNRFEITTSVTDNTFSLYGDSDELGSVIYPKVQIKCLTGGDLKITNLTTKNKLYVHNCEADEMITIDGEHKIITTSNEAHTTLCSDFNYGYLDIQTGESDELENVYEVSIPCEITITYAPIRKVGV